MTVEILYKNTSTLPSGFEITFTVGRIAKDEQNSDGMVSGRIDPSIAPVSPPVHTYDGADDANAGGSNEVSPRSANIDIIAGAPVEAAPAPLPEPFEPPAFVAVPRNPLRPHCLHQDNLELCAGSGSKHCYSCLKARDEALVSA